MPAALLTLCWAARVASLLVKCMCLLLTTVVAYYNLCCAVLCRLNVLQA